MTARGMGAFLNSVAPGRKSEAEAQEAQRQAQRAAIRARLAPRKAIVPAHVVIRLLREDAAFPGLAAGAIVETPVTVQGIPHLRRILEAGVAELASMSEKERVAGVRDLLQHGLAGVL